MSLVRKQALYRCFFLYVKKASDIGGDISLCVGYAFACLCSGLLIASMASLLSDAFASVSIFVKHECLPRGCYIAEGYTLHCLCGPW